MDGLFLLIHLDRNLFVRESIQIYCRILQIGLPMQMIIIP
jgi:hypothetical protein